MGALLITPADGAITKIYPLSMTYQTVTVQMPGVVPGCISFVLSTASGCNGSVAGFPGAKVSPLSDEAVRITSGGATGTVSSFRSTGLYKLCHASSCSAIESSWTEISTANQVRVTTPTLLTRVAQANAIVDIHFNNTYDGDLVAFAKNSNNCYGAMRNSYVVSNGKVTTNTMIDPGQAYICYSTANATQDSQFFINSVTSIRFLSNNTITDIRPNSVAFSTSITISFDGSVAGGGINLYYFAFIPSTSSGCQGAISKSRSQIGNSPSFTNVIPNITEPGLYKLCMSGLNPVPTSDADFVEQANILLQVYNVTNPVPLTVLNTDQNSITIPGSSGKYVSFSRSKNCYSSLTTKLLSTNDVITMNPLFLAPGKYYPCFGSSHSTADYHFTSPYQTALFTVLPENVVDHITPRKLPISTAITIKLIGSAVTGDYISFTPEGSQCSSNNVQMIVQEGGIAYVEVNTFSNAGSYQLCYATQPLVQDELYFIPQNTKINVIDVTQMIPDTIGAYHSDNVKLLGNGVTEGDFVSFVTASNCFGAYATRLAVGVDSQSLLVSIGGGVYHVCYGPADAQSDMDFVDLSMSSNPVTTLTVFTPNEITSVRPISLIEGVQNSISFFGIQDGDYVALIPSTNTDCTGSFSIKSQVMGGVASFFVGTTGSFKFCYGDAAVENSGDFVEQSIIMRSYAISLTPKVISTNGGNITVNGSSIGDFISFVNQPNCFTAHAKRQIILASNIVQFGSTAVSGLLYVCYAPSTAQNDGDYFSLNSNNPAFRVISPTDVSKVYPLIVSSSVIESSLNSVIGNFQPGDYLSLVNGTTCSGSLISRSQILPGNKVAFSEISGLRGNRTYRICLGDISSGSGLEYVMQSSVQVAVFNFSGNIIPSTANVGDAVNITIPGANVGDFAALVTSNQNCVNAYQQRQSIRNNRILFLAGDSNMVASTYYVCYGLSSSTSDSDFINLKKSITFSMKSVC